MDLHVAVLAMMEKVGTSCSSYPVRTVIRFSFLLLQCAGFDKRRSKEQGEAKKD